LEALLVSTGVVARGEMSDENPSASVALAARPDAFGANISRTTLGG
jgi:hypothetical protein